MGNLGEATGLAMRGDWTGNKWVTHVEGNWRSHWGANPDHDQERNVEAEVVIGERRRGESCRQ